MENNAHVKMESFSDALSLAWQRYRQSGRGLIRIAAVGYASTLIINFFDAVSPGLIYPSLALAIDLVGIVFALWASLAIIIAIVSPEPLTVSQAFGRTLEQRPLAAVGTLLLFLLLVIIGSVLLILPGIYILIAGMFYLFVIYKERIYGWSALKRSRELTRGYWWAVFWRWFLFLVIVVAVTGFITYIIGLVAEPWLSGDKPEKIGKLLGSISSFFFYPLSITFVAVLYENLVRLKAPSA